MAVEETQQAMTSGSFDEIASILDARELQTADQLVDWPITLHLLAHIYNLNLEDARMLWKRLPDPAKQDPQNKAAFVLLQALWQKDFVGTWAALAASQWAPDLQILIAQLTSKIRQRATKLLTLAYSKISLDRAAGLMGLPVEEASAYLQSQGWELDGATKILTVHRKPQPSRDWNSSEQVQRLTEYVCHLEHS